MTKRDILEPISIAMLIFMLNSAILNFEDILTSIQIECQNYNGKILYLLFYIGGYWFAEVWLYGYFNFTYVLISKGTFNPNYTVISSHE